MFLNPGSPRDLHNGSGFQIYDYWKKTLRWRPGADLILLPFPVWADFVESFSEDDTPKGSSYKGKLTFRGGKNNCKVSPVRILNSTCADFKAEVPCNRRAVERVN